MSNTKITLGFIAGIAVGAIAGILLAPDSGEQTRRKIMDASGDLAGSIKDVVGGVFGKVADQVANTEDIAATSMAANEEKIRRVMHNAKEEIA